ncbi:DUF86 domain-containing protein [Candidatus Daviesbacteria bacterium]|nr:DUF86 domain-containing protein [Candidatus Daviesbacteria bacterium]
MTKNLTIFLQDILESIKLIEKRIKNATYEKFIEDIDLQDMIIRRLEIIGEAVRNLPKEFRQQHSKIDWKSPADMRSILIHGYFRIDLKVVWDTAVNDLPPFKKQIQKILDQVDK